MTELLQDVRYAFRQLRRAPGFAVTAVLTLALGIGATTAIFTLAYGVLLRRLPVVNPAELYSIGDARDCCISGGLPAGQQYSIFSQEAFQELRKALPEFVELAAMPANSNNGPHTARRADGGSPAQQLHSSYVSGNYFQMFGLSAARGRLLTDADDQEGAPPVAVMSYTTWLNQFNGDPTVIGSTFLLDNRPVTVVGIAPASFDGDRVSPRARDFYVPIAAEAKLSDTLISKNTHLRSLYLVGRVRPNTDIVLLQQKIDVRLRAYLASTPDYKAADVARELPRVHAPLVRAATGVEQLQKEVGQGIHLLLALSALVLLIACANVANLLLARIMARSAELSTRIALGAARSRILRQSLTESLLLAFAGYGCGILLAYGGARAILALAFPQAHSLPINAAPSLPVLLFALMITVATGLVFGVVPALAATRSQPIDALQNAHRGSTSRTSLSQRTLVVLQTTFSLVLITVAALLTRSLSNLDKQDLGLRTEDITVVHLDPGASGYAPARYEGLMRRLEQRLSNIPGTANVAFAQYSPLEGEIWGERVVIEGRPDPALHQDMSAAWDRVSPNFFSTMGEPLLQGHSFTESDRAGTPLVAVVNQKFARKFFPDEQAIGKRFGTELHHFDYTIVGVVADAKFQSPEKRAEPMYFRSMLQPNPRVVTNDAGEIVSLSPHAVLVRQMGPANGYQDQARRALAEVDPNLAILDLRSLRSQVAGELNDQRMLASLTSAFGLIALLLASIGLYGVTAYAVAQRVPEIGLRMALGSDRAGILRLVLRGALTQTLIGLAIGIPAALSAGHLLQAQLFGISGTDAASLITACMVLALSALAASLLPARRAAAIEPMQALRAE